jgi:NAD(P)-dependent dehydrogenase (short-subunit alcohol dehydrogenase family)
MTATQSETMDTETVAVLGAGGTMGFPIARNIARAGIPVRAWNRSRDKAEPLTKDGAYLAETPVDAARGAGIVITMLADEDAVVASMEGPEGALSAMAEAHRAAGNRAQDPYGPQHPLRRAREPRRSRVRRRAGPGDPPAGRGAQAGRARVRA